MTQPLDFSNQDLRDRSFEGWNLAGANFRKADIRGCDFSKANLEGADFSGVTAGQTGKQLFIALAFAFAGISTGIFTNKFANSMANTVAISFNFEWAFAIAVAFGLEVAVACAVAVIGWLVISGACVLALWAVNGDTLSILESVGRWPASAFGGAFVGAGINAGISAGVEFSKGNIGGGIGYCFLLFSHFIYVFVFFGFFVIENIRNGIGTSFEGALLAGAKFTGAILKNCNFEDSNLNKTDWTHAHFNRCKLSGNLNNQIVRELCVSRIGIHANLSSNDLSGLNLIRGNLNGANLTSASLNETNLSQADLENTNLYNVQAIKTDFTSANLTGACIENWAITPETIFTNVVCSHIFFDSAKNERKPASGSFEQGDFEKLVLQFTKTLDFLFRNGIDPQAFDFALNNLMEDYEEMGISLKGIDDLGDGDRLVRFSTVPNAPKGEMHAQFTQDYEEMHQKLEASRNKVQELQQKLDRIDLENKIERFELEKQLAVAIAKLEERPTSQYLQNLVYHQTTQLGQQKSIYALNSQFGDPMSDKSIQSGGDTFIIGDKNKGVFGKDQQGVAGRNISGTVTNTIQQLRETNQPEAPQLSDLLEQLQKAVENSSELGELEKQKALEYLNQIGEMSAKDPSQKKGMLPILLDAFTGVISKATSLIDPVKKIAAAILSIWS